MSISASLDKRFSLRSVLSYDYTGGGIYVVSGEAYDEDAHVLRFFCGEACDGACPSDITFYSEWPVDVCDLTADYDKYICGSYAEGTEECRSFWLSVFAEEMRQAFINKQSAADIDEIQHSLPAAKKGSDCILSGSTAASLNEGDFLRFSDRSGLALVTDIMPVYRGSSVMGYRITLKFSSGRKLYLEKMSAFYGSEIIRQVSE